MLRLVICAVLSSIALMISPSSSVAQPAGPSFRLWTASDGRFQIHMEAPPSFADFFCQLPEEVLEVIRRGEDLTLMLPEEACKPVVNGRAFVTYYLPPSRWGKVEPIGIVVSSKHHSASFAQILYVFVEKTGEVRKATKAEVDRATQLKKAI